MRVFLLHAVRIRSIAYSLTCEYNTGDEMTGHGFRGMASTMLHEQGWNTDVIERQLAHAERHRSRPRTTTPSIVRADTHRVTSTAGTALSAKPCQRASHGLAYHGMSAYNTHVTSADLIKELEAHGFARVSVRGSHHKYRNKAGVTVIVPHPRKDLGKGLIAAIRKQAGL